MVFQALTGVEEGLVAMAVATTDAEQYLGNIVFCKYSVKCQSYDVE